jgi:hypothetical protein
MSDGGRVVGQGENRAHIYDRHGRAEVAVIGDTSNIEWSRALNGVSTASVTAIVPGGSDSPRGPSRARCCADLGRIGVWGHTLAIFRDNARVWEGPIRRVTWRRDSVTIDAQDVAAWAGKRRVHTEVLVEEPSTVPVHGQGVTAFQRAFALDDPNVAAYIDSSYGDPVAYPVNRDVAVNNGMYLDDINTLTGQGLRWTVVGRRIVVFTANRNLGTLPTLKPENHLLADIEIVEDGDLAATEAVARDDEQATLVVTQPLQHPGLEFMGLVDVIVSTGPGSAGVSTLTQAAENALGPSNPVPLQTIIPDGATLRADAPFPIGLLVPGVLVPVVSRSTCREVSATMRLTKVTVKQTAGGTESVGISVAALESS